MTLRRSRLGPGAKSRERGSTFTTPRSELRRTRLRSERRAISEASPEQRAKIAAAPFCIACGVQASDWVTVDPAHLASRAHGGCDHPDCVVGLCRTPGGKGCHRLFDDGKLCLLSILVDRWPSEAPEVQHMLAHMTPVEMLERLANARTQWEDLAA